MGILHSFFVLFHLLGAAIIVGIWFANIKKPTIMAGQFHAALLQLVTGFVLVVMAETSDSGDVNHAKVGIKLLIALAIAVVAYVGQKKSRSEQEVSTNLSHGLGLGTILNMAIAVMW